VNLQNAQCKNKDNEITVYRWLALVMYEYGIVANNARRWHQ